MRRLRHLKPREIQGCSLALDASIPSSLYDATSGGSLVAANGAVARWEDQSGNARHVTQSTSGNRPRRRIASRGGMDALQQNAASASMATSAFYPSAGAGDVTIVSVSLANTSAAYSCAWQYGNASVIGGIVGWLPRYDTTRSAVDFFSSYIGRSGTPTEAGNWHCHAYVASSASTIQDTQQFVNTKSVSEDYTLLPSSSLNVATGVPFRVFNSSTNNVVLGYGAFFATYPSALNASVLARLEHSCMRKWRING